MLGMGAMLHQLGGGSPKNASDYYGRKITNAVFKNDQLRLTFEDGVTVKIWDDAQSCCENRYMVVDDDLTTLVGKTLKTIEVKYVDEPVEYGDHEVAFLEIVTDQNVVSVATHNEHNGYYGGFGLSIDEVG